jgi:hypothetical protein
MTKAWAHRSGSCTGTQGAVEARLRTDPCESIQGSQWMVRHHPRTPVRGPSLRAFRAGPAPVPSCSPTAPDGAAGPNSPPVTLRVARSGRVRPLPGGRAWGTRPSRPPVLPLPGQLASEPAPAPAQKRRKAGRWPSNCSSRKLPSQEVRRQPVPGPGRRSVPSGPSPWTIMERFPRIQARWPTGSWRYSTR